MRFVSWCSGIGGIDLGLVRCGHTPVAHSEIDPYACAVYARHFPGVPNLGNLVTLDPSAIPDADLWAGGIPCQPYSRANSKTRGSDHPSFIWPAFIRLVRAAKPRRLLLENVAALLARDGGFGRISFDLAACGYLGSWACLRSDEFGAEFQGARVYLVAAKADRDGESDESVHDEVARLPTLRPEIRKWPNPPIGLRSADGIPHRLHRLRLLGNSASPQVVEAIARKVWG